MYRTKEVAPGIPLGFQCAACLLVNQSPWLLIPT